MTESEKLKKILDLAESKYHGGDYHEAIHAWEKALSLDPEALRAKEGIKMAKLLLEAGDNAEIDPKAGEGEPSAAKPPATMDGIGDLQALLKMNQAAENSIQKHVGQGWELLKKGDRDGAVRECQEALVLDGSNPEVLKLHEALAMEDFIPDDFAPSVAEKTAPTSQSDPQPETQPTPQLDPPPESQSTPQLTPQPDPEPTPQTVPEPEIPQEEAVKPLPVTEETLSPPLATDEDPGKQGEEEIQLVPDALKAGGTEYGQWESELSQLDLDDSVNRLGKDAPPDTSELQNGGEVAEEPVGPSDMPDAVPFQAEPSRVIAAPPEAAAGKSFGGKRFAILGVLMFAAAGIGWFVLRGTGNTASRHTEDPSGSAGTGSSLESSTSPPPISRNHLDSTRVVKAEEIVVPPPVETEIEARLDAVAPLSEAEKRIKVESMVEKANRLFLRGRYQQAQDILRGAMALDPVNFPLKDLLDKVNGKLAGEKRDRETVDTARSAFKDGDFEIALRKLYRSSTGAEREPTRTYIRNSWFNWGLQLMRAGNCSEAVKKLQEALAIDPENQETLKLESVADRYSRQVRDKIFYAFIDQIQIRTMESP